MDESVIDELTNIGEHPEGEQSTGTQTKTTSSGFSWMTYFMLGSAVLFGVFIWFRFLRR